VEADNPSTVVVDWVTALTRNASYFWLLPGALR
jgi:hypothetical protein